MKRAFDLSVAILGLIVLAPILLAISACIRLVDGSPVLFRQTRVGRHGEPFEMLKFRSMREAEGSPITAGRDPRITPLGRLLRRTKLDELPQLWNVLRGDMSIVGPRPEIPRYVDLRRPEQRVVLEVRPGITGAAQLEGFDEEDALAAVADPEAHYRSVLLPRKLAIDAAYARESGLGTDLGILVRTLARLWHRRGGSTPG